MKRKLTKLFLFCFLLASTMFILDACNMQSEKKENTSMTTNPFFSEWGTPFEVPNFDKIKNEHYKAAFEKGMADQQQEIAAITNNTEAPSFSNTLEALEFSGALLDKVANTFYNSLSATTSDSLQQIAKELSPALSKHGDDIMMNAELFARLKVVYENADTSSLTTEQQRLLEQTYKGFVRSGALLSETEKTKLRKINENLSVLSLKFGENQLAEDNNWHLLIDKEEDLAGLPESAIEAAKNAATEAGHDEKWMITMHKPSWIPFIQYAENKTLRDKVYAAWMQRGSNDNKNDNKEIVAEMASLRVQKAKLLGYESWAAYVLDDNMAKDAQHVYELLNKLWEKALPMAKQEASDLQAVIEKDGHSFTLSAADWWYYAEKLRKEKYDLDEELLRPYFELENVKQGVFYVAGRLWGLQFEERKDLPVPHPDAVAYEVKEADGAHVGILYMDFFPRASKRGGAWMSAYRKQYGLNENKTTPVITNVFNFSKPTATKPALLTFEEVETIFHEFGHGLHGLLSNCQYKSLSGTAVARDFVELPSQVMENWAAEPEVMQVYAKHYKTGELIPQDLVKKLEAASKFNQGFATVEYLAASFLDLQWHTLTTDEKQDVLGFEKKSMDAIGLIDAIIPRYKSTYFSHIFAGGYSAGYYSYVWAEVLDADAFAAFKETGDIFNPEKAKAFRENILSKGDTEDPMVLYKRFRGKDPAIEPLLAKKGLL